MADITLFFLQRTSVMKWTKSLAIVTTHTQFDNKKHVTDFFQQNEGGEISIVFELCVK